MRHETRRNVRYPLAGTATLVAGDQTITAQVLDISIRGMLLRIAPEHEVAIDHQNTLRCRIEAPDLPAPVECLVRPARKRIRIHGFILGCEIMAIKPDQLILLKAYRALAKIRRPATAPTR